MTRLIAAIVSICLMVLGMDGVSSQTYPNKSIRMVTSETGGGNDLQARLVAQAISGPLGQPVIVDNRPALTAIDTVAKATPDGYVLLTLGNPIWITPLLQKVPWDAVKDFSPVSLVEHSPNLLVVHPSVAAKSVKELVAFAKAKPGGLNYSSGPIGGSAYLAAELFKSMAGVNIVHIPYKSGGLGVAGVVAGETQLSFSGGGSVTQHLKSGKLRALAVTSAQPSVLFPELPTVAAAVPGYESVSLTGVFVPAKTPASIIARLNREVVRALNQPDMREKFLGSGSQPMSSTPAELAAAINAELARWGKLIKDLGIKRVE